MLPTVAQDPRFRAGRALVQKGQAAAAVTVFASLLETARTTFGEAHVETAPAYYEYGNALLRGAPSPEEEDASSVEGGEVAPMDRKRQAAAQAAEHRLVAPADPDEEDQKPAAQEEDASPKKEDSEHDDNDDDGSDDDELGDVALALEMMETAWSILDDYVSTSKGGDTAPQGYLAWARDQLPRYLTGIGDALSSLTRHADAADAYARALTHRLERVQQHVAAQTTETVEHLTCRRLVVEATILLAEEFLAGPPDQDVVTSETQLVLVQAAGKVDYARGYYDKARDELQETVLLMGEMAAQGLDVAAEKKDICFVSTMVMGVGMRLAELDELAAAAATTLAEPVKKKAKKG
jgi:hypothetical protein